LTYDTKCYELAEHFLGSKPEIENLRKRLAYDIQCNVEAWLEMERDQIIESIIAHG